MKTSNSKFIDCNELKEHSGWITAVQQDAEEFYMDCLNKLSTNFEEFKLKNLITEIYEGMYLCCSLFSLKIFKLGQTRTNFIKVFKPSE